MSWHGMFFVCTDSGVYRLSRGGARWQSLTSFPPKRAHCIAADSSSTLFAACDSSLFSSGDSGVTWKPLHVMHGPIMQCETDGDSLVYVFEGSAGLSVLHRATGVWRALRGTRLEGWAHGLSVRGPVIMLWKMGVNKEVPGLIRSTDGGEHWQAPIQGYNVKSVYWHDATVFTSADPCGICMSRDSGAHWLIVNTGMSDCGCVVPSATFVNAGGALLAVNKCNDLYRWRADAAAWEPTVVGERAAEGSNFDVLSEYGGFVYAPSRLGGMARRPVEQCVGGPAGRK